MQGRTFLAEKLTKVQKVLSSDKKEIMNNKIRINETVKTCQYFLFHLVYAVSKPTWCMFDFFKEKTDSFEP